MEAAVRLVRLVQIAMLVSVVLYVAAGELVGRGAASNNGLFYTLSLAAISTLGAVLVVRRTLVLPVEVLLQGKPGDAMMQARWKSAYIFLYSLCEVVALFGLILRLAGFTLAHVWGFYLGGFLLLLLFSPRPPGAHLR
jgi:hypothetical protein